MDKERFLCTSCNYKFKRSVQPKSCPFCGKLKTVDIDISRGAQDILDEISDMEKEFRRWLDDNPPPQLNIICQYFFTIEDIKNLYELNRRKI